MMAVYITTQDDIRSKLYIKGTQGIMKMSRCPLYTG